MLKKAIDIAINAHAGQIDKAGQPYIRHLFRVMEKGKTEVEQICGVLHDLVEDTNWTFEKLKEEGFSDEIIEVLRCVTKQHNEDYSSFIERISKNKVATIVKLNDLEDNMNITRLKEIKETDCERLNKYLKAYHFLFKLK